MAYFSSRLIAEWPLMFITIFNWKSNSYSELCSIGKNRLIIHIDIPLKPGRNKELNYLKWGWAEAKAAREAGEKRWLMIELCWALVSLMKVSLSRILEKSSFSNLFPKEFKRLLPGATVASFCGKTKSIKMVSSAPCPHMSITNASCFNDYYNISLTSCICS